MTYCDYCAGDGCCGCDYTGRQMALDRATQDYLDTLVSIVRAGY